MSIEEIVENIEARWATYQVETRYPRINWDLAWGTVKMILLKEKKKQAEIKQRWEWAMIFFGCVLLLKPTRALAC